MVLLLVPWLTQRVPLAPRPDEVRHAVIPERPQEAATGSAFIERLRDLSDDAREHEILEQLQLGNLPSFLRQLRPVDVVAKGADGRRHRGRYWVMPDYLAIGTDEDFVRIPMTPITAQLVADRFDCVLPTRRMVEQIFRKSRIHLAPEPLPAGPDMTSSEYFRRHNELISAQLKGKAPGELVSGHKKDVVTTKRLLRNPARVAIYGWHKRDGRPIQSLSLYHPNSYVDYSHGIRLVGAVMLVDGAQRSVAEVLKNPALAPLLSDEGPLAKTRLCTEPSRSQCLEAMPSDRLGALVR
jgi:hypothetical protein